MTRKEQIGDATLYCGDCLEILPTLGKVDAVVTDPPYGVNENTKRGSAGRGRFVRSRDWDAVIGDDRPFDPTPFLIAPKVMLWGGNNYSLPGTRGWFVWDKRPNCPSDDNGDCELAWTNLNKPIRKHSQLWRGCIRAGEEKMANQNLQHPTQKPLALMLACIEYIGEAATILDPFMGSGTTGVACAKLGRKFIGIEIEPNYFDTACRRIEQAYAQPDLFIEPPAKPKQETML